MNRRTPVSTRTLSVLVIALLAPLAACQVSGGSSGSSGGSGGSGNGGIAGGSDSGGSGSGGSGSGGTAGGSGSGGARTGGMGGGGGGMGGAGTGGAAGTGGSSSELANFATVREIVSVTCGGSDCHQPGGTPPALLVDDAKLFSTLTTFVSKKCGNRVLVKKGSPQDSAFYLAQAGLCGDSLPRMPLGCVDRCTPTDYLEGIRQWIVNGAPQE
jgi:hypothetical protein